MIIGFDAKRATHNHRGLGNYSRELISALDFYHPEIKKKLFTPHFNNHEFSTWEKSLKNSEFIFPPGRLFKEVPSLWRSFGIKNDLDREELDIFHGLSHELPFTNKVVKFKKVVTIHDLIILRYPKQFTMIDRNVYLNKMKFSVSNADVVLAICEQTKQDLMEFLKVPESKIRVHYQSCYPEFYQTVSTSSIKEKYQLPENFILNVGALEERKNQINLLKAFHHIKDKTDWNLVLVGKGKDYKKLLLDYIHKFHLEKRVKILEDVPFSDLPAIYQSAGLFVFPSYFEGFGIPIIESMFSKVPVIVSKGSCFPETAGPDSLFIDPHNIEEISHEILRMIDHSALREEVALKGLSYVERFHREKTTEKLVQIYQELI